MSFCEWVKNRSTMGLTPVFCCLRTDSCLQGTEEEVRWCANFTQPFRSLGDSDESDTVLPAGTGWENWSVMLPTWEPTWSFVERVEERQEVDRKWSAGLMILAFGPKLEDLTILEALEHNRHGGIKCLRGAFYLCQSQHHFNGWVASSFVLNCYLWL